jgi:cytochrome c-type biogenesis protein CcmH
MLAFVAAALLLVALLGAAIVAPIVSKRRTTTEPAPGVLAERLGAIERDRASGFLGEAEAAEAIIEAKRAALAANVAPTAEAVSRGARLAAFGFAGAAPLVGAFVYLAVGAPELIGRSVPPPGPRSIAEMAPDQQAAAIRGMVESLAARLGENPEDADGWRMLARSYAVLGEQAKSADALRELLNRVEGDVDDWRAYAAALMAQGPGGGREAEVARAIGKLKSLDPDDPMALYFEGEAARAAGDATTAVARWRRLLEVLPPDAPVRSAVEKLIDETGASRSAP